MKKVLYLLLLVGEAFVGTLLMTALCNSALYIPVAAVAVAVVGLLIWQLVRYGKTSDPAVKKKILRNIALILLIPSAAFAITFVGVAISFIVAFA